MLEIRDLVKVYKTKGGAEVRALDNVSVRFEEKGMVFLLGKSGSGKSTFLNLCGGLDSPDSGEIIIKGRSSKDFSQSDFDSYRNTFVGFVFQEYNILDEFTVEDNIALALELQGKNKNKAQVHSILEQVDLANFAKRKPNTLSGGQKQRVAIARALVKNPEIIMADEPTGALDSNTGKQVFDTLKKLSAEKLVIVVSHDREFAEIYGDRIIELKDGKIISDVTKTKIAAVAASDNVSFVGNDTISIKSGSKLSASDIEKINQFLAASSEDVIITNGRKEISDFRKAARIDESGAREAFRETDEKNIAAKAYTPQDSRFIRSKLPARHAIRIGASSMKVKPFRLLFTILLSFVAFTLFGLFSTLAFYDPVSTAVETYMGAGYDTLMLQKKYQSFYVEYQNGEEVYRSNYPSQTQTLFTPADLREHRETYGDNTLGIYDFSTSEWSSMQFKPENISITGNYNTVYFDFSLSGFAEIGATWNGEMLTSDTDLSALGDDEIVISSYTFESIREGTFYEVENGEMTDTEISLNTPEDIVGKPLLFQTRNGTKELTVRGVYRYDLPEEFDSIKDASSGQITNEQQQNLKQTINYGLYKYAIVSPAFYDANVADFGESYSEDTDYGFMWMERELLMTSEGDENTVRQAFYNVNSLPIAQGVEPQIAFLDGRPAQSLSGKEIVVPFGTFSGYLYNVYSDKVSPLFTYISDTENNIENQLIMADEYTYKAEEADRLGNTEEAEFLREQAEYAKAEAKRLQTELDAYLESEEYLTNVKPYEKYYENWERYTAFLSDGQYSYWNEEMGTEEYEVATEDDLDAAAEMIISFFREFGDEIPTRYNLTFTDLSQDMGTYTVVGFFYGQMAAQNREAAYFSADEYQNILRTGNPNNDSGEIRQEYETKYEKPADAIYRYIVIPFPDSESVLRTLLAGENQIDAETDTFYTINSLISANLNMVNGMIDQMSDIFLYIGITLAAFAMLLLFNFISVSIANKKKEIGILRAVGARSTDVFKIFYSESVIITAICFVLAMVASFVVCAVLNNTIQGMIGASIFVFGPLSWLVMLGIAVVTSVIATFLPVYSAAKRKPVESIRAL